MCAIKIMESILGSTILVVNRCDNISTPRQAKIHPETVKSRRKQVDLISSLSDVYQSMDSGMSMVYFHGHQNIRRLVSTLIPLESLNVILDVLEDHIIAAFLLS